MVVLQKLGMAYVQETDSLKMKRHKIDRYKYCLNYVNPFTLAGKKRHIQMDEVKGISGVSFDTII